MLRRSPSTWDTRFGEMRVILSKGDGDAVNDPSHLIALDVGPFLSAAAIRIGLSLSIGLAFAGDLFAQSAKPNSISPTPTPHPAIVQVVVKEPTGESHGSGTLIDVRDDYGLVLTNWHVIRDAKNEILVLFPDGFRSLARVVRTDPDWDLAAISIWKPTADPIPLSDHTPSVGERLAIAGYGQGQYRVVAGPVTQFVAPSDKHPNEMVEVGVEARQGDSGGPILDSQGALSGVLFGTAKGVTTGSHVGRVRTFLDPILDGRSTPIMRPERVADGRNAMAAGRNRKSNQEKMPQMDSLAQHERKSNRDHSQAISRESRSMELEPVDTSAEEDDYVDSTPRRRSGGSSERRTERPVFGPADDGEDFPSREPEFEPRADGDITFAEVFGDTKIEQAKFVLAAIGIIAIVMRVGKAMQSNS